MRQEDIFGNDQVSTIYVATYIVEETTYDDQTKLYQFISEQSICASETDSSTEGYI